MHTAFKAHVARWRGMLDVDAVGTGEVWQGREAQALGLVDEVLTSEEYLTHRMRAGHDVIKMAPAPDVRRWFLPRGPGGGGGGGPPLPIGSSWRGGGVLGVLAEAVVACVGGGGGAAGGEGRWWRRWRAGTGQRTRAP